jgi:hypothetical protein
LVPASEAKKVPELVVGQFFSIVFELPRPHRKTNQFFFKVVAQHVIKTNREKIGFGFFVDFFVKAF